MRQVVFMLNLAQDIHSLTDFKRNSNVLMKQMKQTGRPVVLTVNGKAELVVQDAESYQKLMETLERLEAIEAIREGIEDVEQGRTMSLEEFDKEMRRKYGIPR